MIRVLLDQGLPRSAAQLLRAEGWDAVHVAEGGMSRSPDIEILKLAHNDNRTVVTLDADFHALLAVQGLARPSVTYPLGRTRRVADHTLAHGYLATGP